MKSSLTPLSTNTFSEEALTSSALWDNEFASVQSIPSSTRVSAAKGVAIYRDLLHFDRIHTVLDAGCGNGRNAVYFAMLGAHVVAVDSSPIACKLTRALMRSTRTTASSVDLFQEPIEEFINRDRLGFDLILDSYVSCHIHDPIALRSYLTGLLELLKPGGYLLSLQFAADDEFYASNILRRRPQLLAHDPANRVIKRLYEDGELERVISGIGEVEYNAYLHFMDIVRGRPYQRSIIALAIRHRDSLE